MMGKKTIQQWLMVAGCVGLTVVLSGCATTTPLSAAAESGDVKQIQQALENGADINSRGIWGQHTLLTGHAVAGNENMVRWILAKGADINATTGAWPSRGNHSRAGYSYFRYFSPLQCAAWNGHEGVVKILLENGADTHYVAEVCICTKSPEVYAFSTKNAEFETRRMTAADMAEYRGYSSIVSLINNAERKRVGEIAQKQQTVVADQLKNKTLVALLKTPLSNSKPCVAALTDALIEAKVTQLSKFLLTASYDEKTAAKVELEKRLLQSAVALQQCNNEAQGFAEQGNQQKTTECRNLATSLLSYQAALKAIKAELEQ